MPYLGVTFVDGAAMTGDFIVDLGSSGSYVDPGAFPAPGPELLSCREGMLCQFLSVQVLGGTEKVRFTWGDYKDRTTGLRQAGIVGTDFTSEKAVALHYSESALFVADLTTFCKDEELLRLGLVPTSSEGYYSDKFAKLKRMHEVKDTQGSLDEPIDNVPVAQVRVAGVTLPAQLDTGFDDSKAMFSVNVNTAWLEAVQTAQPGLLRRVEVQNPISLTTCVAQISEELDQYETSNGTPLMLEMLGTDKEVIRAFVAKVFVKKTPKEAMRCGGIGTWKVPAAQIGASFFQDLDLVVFDPLSARVWLRRDG